MQPETKKGSLNRSYDSCNRDVQGKKLLDSPVILGNAATHMQELNESPAGSIWTKTKPEELVRYDLVLSKQHQNCRTFYLGIESRHKEAGESRS
jgi:hypothetical protein